ncbi:hypothetical protein KDA_56880 [Dictyobacter alpinus]|uniref:TIGR02677 family protein n=1 Tax=Dictyobacter alpinus TaxID=2014873 RepID=A0A402BFR1_9CHLR|nr:TIGR02677 family protein [Dictyobacter alpinus]GCE30204.1 hypothetical protein KDA_56880 [Dictyobacter alpinus]
MTSLDAHEALLTREEYVESANPHQGNVAASVTTFQPFGTILLFNYLTPISDRTDWYRSIMRTFFQSSRKYRYQLTAEDVVEAVRDDTKMEYHLDACKGDLDRLVKWGNLTTLYDTSRVTTIADFRSPILRYQASPEALEIEGFLASHAHVGASEGGLYQGDLPLLWQALQTVDRWLNDDQSSYTPERRQEIAEQWRQAFTAWEKVVNDAAQYLGSMNQSAQQAVNMASYLSYKNIVVNYIQSFAQQLVQHSNAVRSLLLTWVDTEKKERLLAIITSTPPPIQSLAENPDRWREDVQQQIEAFEEWFIRESNVAMFLKAARDAVEKVVQRAHALASSMRPHTDYVTMLHGLAGQFMQTDDLQVAQQLYASAFASSTPIHLPEGLTGSPEVTDRRNERKPWNETAAVTRSLRPIYKGNVERVAEQPMRSNTEALYHLKLTHDTQNKLQQQRFAHIFQTELLDLGTIKTIAPEERAAITEVIDGCLCSPALEYSLPDGSLVTLLNRDEQAYISLHSQDGVLLVPRYRLRRQLPASRLS